MTKLSEYKNQIVVIVAVLILCVGTLVSTLILSNTNFYIKNLGTSLVQNGQLVNTISVSGDGKVFAKPDMAEITISDSELAGNSADALKLVNSKIDQVNTILKNDGINADDIKTSELSIAPQYDYNGSTSVLKGQLAIISLDVKIKKIDDKATKVSKVIDDVAKVDKVQIGSVTFDIEDKTKVFSQARSDAFNKAQAKAAELAGLAKVKLLTPVSITDTTTDITPRPFAATDNFAKGVASPSTATSISTGELEITVNLGVVFGIN